MREKNQGKKMEFTREEFEWVLNSYLIDRMRTQLRAWEDLQGKNSLLQVEVENLLKDVEGDLRIQGPGSR